MVEIISMVGIISVAVQSLGKRTCFRLSRVATLGVHRRVFSNEKVTWLTLVKMEYRDNEILI